MYRRQTQPHCLAKVFFLLLTCLALQACTSWYMLTTPEGQPVDQAHLNRTLGTKINDMTIQAKIEANLYKSGLGFRKADVTISSYNGIVLLTGTVPSETLKTMATKLAKNTREVRQVHNKLSVGSNRSAAQKTRDGWLNMKVRSKLTTNRLVPDERIECITSQGVTYLMGRVTPIEDKRTVQAIRNTRGLKKIVKVFETVAPTEYASSAPSSNTRDHHQSATPTPRTSGLSFP